MRLQKLKRRGTSRGLSLSPLPPYIQNGRRPAALQAEVPWTHMSPQTRHDCPAPDPGGRTKKKTAQLWVGQGPPACLLLSALPMWEALVPSQCGSGELTALKGFLNLCSSKPAARRSFGVWSTRSLNLEGRRPEVYLMVTGNTGCCCDRQLPSPLQPRKCPTLFLQCSA